jgi:hypothetical protein
MPQREHMADTISSGLNVETDETAMPSGHAKKL